MIQIVLSAESQELVARKVASGRYHDINAVFEDALLALEERERLEDLRAMIAVGDEEIERGDVELFTPELAEQLRQEAIQLAREGQEADPDVRP
jgi:putative addiction module CopG family antidote